MNHFLKRTAHLQARQLQRQGFALPLALFALIITAIIATASVKLGLLDQSLARNQSDTMLAKQHAEFTINDAIDHVLCKKDVHGGDIPKYDQFTGNTPIPDIAPNTCVAGLCGVNSDLNKPLWAKNTGTPWDDLKDMKPSTGFSAAYGQYTGQTRIAANLGHYIIESVKTNVYTGSSASNNEHQYRITAVGFGRNNSNISRTLQVLFRTKNQRCSYNPQQTTASGYIQ